MEQTRRIESFRDLDAWKKGHALVISTYTKTKMFPKEELFCLVSQMRRAGISITSNISEGFSRNSNKEKLQFYYIALGSLTELQNQFYIARDIGYLSQKEFSEIEPLSTDVSRLINGLIKKLNNSPK